jgi:predicted ATPase
MKLFLAAFLYRLKDASSDIYQQIRKTIRLAIPFFDDFVLKPLKLRTEEELIRLLWRQKDSDYSLWPSQLSDGSIRFICLVTALQQPDPPSTIIIDEPDYASLAAMEIGIDVIRRECPLFDGWVKRIEMLQAGEA